MPGPGKRILFFVAALLFAAGCAVLADRIVYRTFGFSYKDTEIASVFTDGSEAIGVAGCDIDDGTVVVTGPDPQFVVNADNQEFSKVRIVFREPPTQNVRLQMFYMPAGEGFSERNSTYRTIITGAKEEVVTIPKARYSSLRFDFEQDVVIDKISIGNDGKVYDEYKPHFTRMGIIGGMLFVPLALYILVKIRKKNKK